MVPYPSSNEVLEDLGTLVLSRFSRAVMDTADDLETYRSTLPGFVDDHGIRGMANWSHDRFWTHLKSQLGSIRDVWFKDNEVTREISIGKRYRLRAKRYDESGGVSMSRTESAREFMSQEPIKGLVPLEGMSRVHLIIGYEWYEAKRMMGQQAILSMWDGLDNCVWRVVLP